MNAPVGWMRALLALVAMLGCAPGQQGAEHGKSMGPPREIDACDRCRRALDRCGGQSAPCDEHCEDARATIRDGFMPAFAGCIERTAAGDACEKMKDRSARQDLVRVCYFASVEVLASQDGGASFGLMAKALCERRARCGSSDDGGVDGCRARLVARRSVDARLLSIVRREALDKLSACIAARPCTEEDPTPACAPASPPP
jgi:hypothetical protein